jgi:hypothetical protein
VSALLDYWSVFIDPAPGSGQRSSISGNDSLIFQYLKILIHILSVYLYILLFQSHPPTQQDFWSGVGCFAHNTLYVRDVFGACSWVGWRFE